MKSHYSHFFLFPSCDVSLTAAAAEAAAFIGRPANSSLSTCCQNDNTGRLAIVKAVGMFKD
jgi:hypothetical protein